MKSDTYQQRICKAAATKLHEELLIEESDEIDLGLIAAHSGNLRIEHGGLNTSDGRLIASKRGGVIRVNSTIKDPGRIRFIVAHELGHYHLHKAKSHLSHAKEFTFWRKGSKESEANWFAAELLMPERMLVPRLKGMVPNKEDFSKLQQEFETSLLASCFQGVSLTSEPSALVFASGGKVAWSVQSRTFGFSLRKERVHSYSASAELQRREQMNDSGGPVDVPAGAWLMGIDPNSHETLKEDCWRVGASGIVSILWLDEEV